MKMREAVLTQHLGMMLCSGTHIGGALAGGHNTPVG